jgi:predicted DNA-binding transcriptional regulator AlpA
MTRQAQKGKTSVKDVTDIETTRVQMVPATMSLGEAASYLGIHRSTAWNLYQRDEFPVPVLKIGGCLRVVRVHILQFIETGERVTFPSTSSASIAS